MDHAFHASVCNMCSSQDYLALPCTTPGDCNLASLVVRYIIGTLLKFLYMKPEVGPTFSLRLVSYLDADIVGDEEDHKSISAVVQFVIGVITGF